MLVILVLVLVLLVLVVVVGFEEGEGLVTVGGDIKKGLTVGFFRKGGNCWVRSGNKAIFFFEGIKMRLRNKNNNKQKDASNI